MKKIAALAALFALAFTTAVFADVKPGQPAPNFTLEDQNGKQVSLSDFSGKIVVLEWVNPNCPYVQRHYKAGTMKSLADEFKSKDVVWLAINSTESSDKSEDKQFVDEHSLPYSILDDHESKVAKEYGAKTTPDMFVIDKDGKLAYKGAIDNDPNGEKSDRVNYVQQALDEITSGKPVSVPETKSYGCGVKYAH